MKITTTESNFKRRWYNMMNRCYNPNNANYKDYGGRGITVCPLWQSDWRYFYAQVSQLPGFDKRFDEKRTLDRIDSDGPYTIGNVRWATPKEQALNRRKPIRV